MKKHLLLFLSLLLITAGSLQAADYYWVDGGGNWSDINHWRLGSVTGETPSIVPSSLDNVYFTASSGFGTTAAQRTVVLDANGFCHSMTWVDVENKPIFNSTNSSYAVAVSGDLSLSADVTYNIKVIFKGATENTIKTNGAVLGYMAIDVDKPGGKLTLLDSLVFNTTNRTNNLALTAGTLDVSGKHLAMVQFNSANDNIRNLNISDAAIDFNYRWDYRGANKTLIADQSDVNIGSYLIVDGGIYHNVTCGGLSSNVFSVNNTTFSSLTFTNTSTASFAQVGKTNIVDSLIFKGRGRIYDNNKINHVIFEQEGLVLGANNTIQYMKNNGNLSITKGPQIIDSLLLAPNKASSFAGVLTISKYLEASGMSCEAFTELTGDTTSFQLIFGPEATASINNVFLTGIRASGPITPLTVTGIDGEGNEGFSFNPPASSGAATYYWVGGAGDWNDKAHWSQTSGGTGDGCIPFINDEVVFDSNSGFTAGNNTVSTSGNVYCHNMSWMPGVGAAVFEESAQQKCLVYGSVILAPSVTMNATLELSGTEAVSATINGSTAGALQFYVKKTDAGQLKVMDDWTNSEGSIELVDGTVDLSERNISIAAINSTQTYPARHIDITNARIHVSNAWRFTGLYKYIESAGSVITSDYIFVTNGLNYPVVNLTYGGTYNAFNISSTSFGALTFTDPGTTSKASINGGNTIRRLEFKGAGSVAGGTNTIDSLILGASRNYTFNGTNAVNKYMRASSVSCTGLSELRGNPTGTLAFDPAAEVEISNVYLMNMAATGQTPSFTGADAGGNTGWTINSAAGSARYWVGGAGDWNNAAHWSITSGGVPGACIPTVYDDVIFDAASGFTSGNNTVTITNGNAYCHNMDWAAVTGAPTFTKDAAWNMEVWGENLKLSGDATFNVSPLILKGNSNTFISGFVKGNFDINIDKQGGSLTLDNDYSNTATDIYVINGIFNAMNKQITVGRIDNSALSNAMSLNISGSVINTNYWRYSGDSTSHTLDASNTKISTPVFIVNAMQYDTVNVSGTLSTHAQLSGAQINKLTFTDTDGASNIGINGAANQIGTLTFKGGGAIYGTANVIDTLIFFPGSSYTFKAATNTTINNAWYGSGTPCKLTEIKTDGGANAIITRSTGVTDFDYIRVKGITAVGIAPFKAEAHSIDLGGNNGWEIAPYDGVKPINGLGPDRAIPKADFPYTLHTDGFFGTPLAQYHWGDGSMLDSLVITDTGTYHVEVKFEDNCSALDDVHITYDLPLPVGLSNFDVKIINCTPILSWTTSQQLNYDAFEVQRNQDGLPFVTIAKVASSLQKNDYTYTDNSALGKSNYNYRLKLVTHKNSEPVFSKVKTAKMDCVVARIRLYPNPTSGIVYVTLPSDFNQVKINVYSASGHHVNAATKIKGKNSTVNLSHLAAGVYFIEVLNNGHGQKFKVIKN
ncbi:hypothetical protein GCM10027566_23190 [Arachidicoccus ginsenosidivorans]